MVLFVLALISGQNTNMDVEQDRCSLVGLVDRYMKVLVLGRRNLLVVSALMLKDWLLVLLVLASISGQDSCSLVGLVDRYMLVLELVVVLG